MVQKGITNQMVIGLSEPTMLSNFMSRPIEYENTKPRNIVEAAVVLKIIYTHADNVPPNVV